MIWGELEPYLVYPTIFVNNSQSKRGMSVSVGTFFFYGRRNYCLIPLRPHLSSGYYNKIGGNTDLSVSQADGAKFLHVTK